MKINRRTFLKRMNWTLAGIIGMLGFAGCEKETGVDYTVKGTVVDKATGKPVAGIRVGYDSGYQVVLMYGTPMPPYTPKASVTTNAKGEFKLTDSFQDGEYQIIENKSTLSVWVQDIDGEKNGLFQSEYLQVEFPKGEHTVTLNVELTEIENG